MTQKIIHKSKKAFCAEILFEQKKMSQIPDSSSSLRMLCSGALIDGKIKRFEGGRGWDSVDASATTEAASCITGKSGLLRAPADTLSFHILPS